MIPEKAAVAGSQGAVAAWLVINSLPMAMFGTSLTVMCMAAFGSFASFVYNAPEISRKRMFALAIVNTFLATITVVILPAWLELAWVKPHVTGPLAAALGFMARFVVPPALEALPGLARGVVDAIQSAAKSKISKLGNK